MYTQEFVKLWNKISKEMKTYMENELGSALTEGQLNVLELLESNPNMKPSDLIPYLSTSPAAITTLLDRMENNGLIVRQRDEKDRRIVWIVVTELGKEQHIRGTETRNRFLHMYLNRISSHNQQLLVYLLGKVSKNTETG